MGNLTIGGALSIGVGIILLLVMISESQDCTFSVERVNIICVDGDNISEKALYVIISIFAIILGIVLYKTDKQING
jgi:hypothetical protein